MKHLWQKDLILFRQYKWHVLSAQLAVYLLFFFFKTDVAMIAIYQMLFGTMFLGMVCLSIDSANRGYQQLFSMPISRNDYVREKFLLFGGIFLEALVLNSVVVTVFRLITGKPLALQSLFVVEFGGLWLFALIMGIYLSRAIPTGTAPLAIFLGALFGVTVVGIGFGLFLESHGFPFKALLDFLLNMNPLLLVILGSVIFLLEWVLLGLYTEKRFAKMDITSSGSLLNVTRMGRVRK